MRAVLVNGKVVADKIDASCPIVFTHVFDFVYDALGRKSAATGSPEFAGFAVGALVWAAPEDAHGVNGFSVDVGQGTVIHFHGQQVACGKGNCV